MIGDGMHVGYIAMHAGPCEAPLRAKYTGLKAFRDSPYGVNYGLPLGVGHFVPYLIDPVTREILYRSDLEIVDALWRPQVILDDSTIVGSVEVDNTHVGMAVLSRSGIAISIGAVQQSALRIASGGHAYARIDSTHFARGYQATVAGLTGSKVEICSVSGGVISIVSTTTFPNVVAVDGLNLFGGSFYQLQHTDGSGWMVGAGETPGFSPTQYQLTHAFSVSGGISATHRTGFPFSASFIFYDGKTGSTESVFLTNFTNNGFVGFYWDGAAGHFGGPNTLFGAAFSAGPQGGGDGNDTNPYLNPNIIVVGSSQGPPGPCVVDQTGTVLTPSGITPVYFCPVDTTDPFGTPYADGSRDGTMFASARHGPGNVAAITNALTGPGGIDLRAFTW